MLEDIGVPHDVVEGKEDGGVVISSLVATDGGVAGVVGS